MNKSPLEQSLREESLRAIREIHEKEAAEVSALEEECAREIDAFKKKTNEEMEMKIEQELSRLENRDSLERKKLALRAVKDFIDRVVGEAVSEMKGDSRYKTFLLNSIEDSLDYLPEAAEIHIRKEDMIFKKEIIKLLKQAEKNEHISVREDASLTWGGCIVKDEAGGHIFNGTVERIFFRKSPAIYREVMEILKHHGFTD